MSAMNNHAGVALSTQPPMTVPEASCPGTDHKDDLTLNPDFTFDRDDYRIRLVNEGHPLHTKAGNLVTSMYGSRGLGIGQSGNRQREQVTLAASRGTDVLGTLTLGVDAGSGLLADSLYQPEINPLRLRGHRLCEVTRLALDPESGSREVMASLFQVAFVLASEVHGRTDVLAEVHPRHAGFYRRTMGYRVAGPERICPRVGAPAVLLHLCLDFARSQIRQLAGTCSRRDRNLYRRFVPAAEQEALVTELVASGSASV